MINRLEEIERISSLINCSLLKSSSLELIELDCSALTVADDVVAAPSPLGVLLNRRASLPN
jgi:hypothetical protein